MFPLNHINNSLNLSSLNIITTLSIYRLLNTSKQEKRREDITTTIATTSLYSNITSFSTSIIQDHQISFEEPYSAKTGIKIAALLGGMLLLVIVYVLWKARSRLYRSFRFSSTNIRNSPLSANKFDLDYWLKQVDLLEAKEAERNREDLSPYLELPNQKPRDNQLATASWITDTCHQWRRIHYRQQHQLIREKTNQQIVSNPIPYQRRRYLLRRFIRRLLTSPNQRSSFLIKHSSIFFANMRPSMVTNNFIPSPQVLDIQPRRVASWPRLKSINYQNITMMNGVQTQNARKRLLKQTSRTNTIDI